MKGSINFFDEFFKDSLGCTFAELFPNTDSESCSHYYSESSVMDSTGHVETVVNDNGKVKRYSGYAPSFDSAVQLSREALAQGKLPNRLPAAYMRGTVLPHTDGFILKDGSLKIECSLLKVSEDRISVAYDNGVLTIDVAEDTTEPENQIILFKGIKETRGAMHREIILDPKDWDGESKDVKVSFSDGVLTIILPKSNKPETKVNLFGKGKEIEVLPNNTTPQITDSNSEPTSGSDSNPGSDTDVNESSGE